jgi:hypothetical protein
MSDSHPWCAGIATILCLGFTGGAAAWADPALDSAHAAYVEDPYAPHDTSGSTVRLGTAVGFIYGERINANALGMTVAAGQRFGRLTIEAEYSYLGYRSYGITQLSLGNGNRLGVIGRFDVIRIGPRWVGENSLLSLYVEGGAAVAWNHWYMPGSNEPDRTVPEDSKRVEGQVGFGLELEHRLQEPPKFPHRIGWFLGWRMAYAPHQAEAASICRGVSCRSAPMMPEDSFTDRSMLFQSSMQVTW